MDILWGILLIIMSLVAYKMGKGDKLDIPFKTLKFAVRNEHQENEIVKKLEGMRKPK